MKRENIKSFFILLIIMFVSEILNCIIYLLFLSLINQLIANGVIPPISGEKTDIISRIIVAVFALLIYYLVGKTIFSRIGDERAKRNIAILMSIIIALSYPIIAHFSIMFEIFYSIHWSMCSPIADVLLLPFTFTKNTVPILFEVVFILLSPISIMLIWLFSKVNVKKNTADEAVTYNVNQNEQG